MTKRVPKETTKVPAFRPMVEGRPRATEDFDGLMRFLQEQREKPIQRASEKLYQFVNKTVSDPDFRDAQSQHLLDFLLIVRDSLTDGINEHWTLEDILKPIADVVKRKAAEGRMRGLDEVNLRKAAAVAWTQDRAAAAWKAGSMERIGEMTERLWREIMDTDHRQERPSDEANFRDWIKPVAPAFATKPGRPKKR